MIQTKYLLYIDILGFADMAQSDSNAVKRVYNIINGINAHKHEGFKTIVFSDTILVVNKFDLIDDHSHRYHVMFSCEFAQDLLHQLYARGTNLHFRAILTYDEFEYYQLSNIECYFGAALINAYRKEKEVNAVGLFIDKRIAKYNQIFPTIEYDKDLDFVFLTQYFNSLQFNTGGYLPLPNELVEWSEEFAGLPAEVEIIKNYFVQSQQHPNPRVRAKYLQTIQFYRSKYPILINKLEAANFNLSVINDQVDWSAMKFFTGADIP